MAAINIFFYVCDNKPFLPRLKRRILLCFAHAKEVRKVNHPYKIININRLPL